MRFTIYFEAAKSPDKVIAHLWDAVDNVWDIPGESVDALNFRFNVDIDTFHRRDIKLKFYFPGEPDKWESDDYIRHVRIHDLSTLWTFEYSSRCLLQSPEGPKVSEIKFNFMTKSKFAGGKILVWNPGAEDIQGEKEYFSETSRDVVNCTSNFVVPVRPWMTRGFHFKLVDQEAEVYEPDSCIRVWRPSDGGEILYKSGEVNPYQQAQMAEKCRATTSKGEPCRSWAMTNGLCRIHQGKSTVLQKLPKSEKEKEKPIAKKTSGSKELPKPEKKKTIAQKCGGITSRGTSCKRRALDNGFCHLHQIKSTESQVSTKPKAEEKKAKKCGIITGKGVRCKNWVMANDRCRSHQDESVGAQTTAEPEKEAPEANKKPAVPPKPPKPKKEKPIAETCEIITSRGTPCKLPVVANGRCRMHQSKSSAPEETFKPEKEEIERKISEVETTKVESISTLGDTILDRVATIVKKMANLLLPEKKNK